MPRKNNNLPADKKPVPTSSSSSSGPSAGPVAEGSVDPITLQCANQQIRNNVQRVMRAIDRDMLKFMFDEDIDAIPKENLEVKMQDITRGILTQHRLFFVAYKEYLANSIREVIFEEEFTTPESRDSLRRYIIYYNKSIVNRDTSIRALERSVKAIDVVHWFHDFIYGIIPAESREAAIAEMRTLTVQWKSNAAERDIYSRPYVLGWIRDNMPIINTYLESHYDKRTLLERCCNELDHADRLTKAGDLLAQSWTALDEPRNRVNFTDEHFENFKKNFLIRGDIALSFFVKRQRKEIGSYIINAILSLKGFIEGLKKEMSDAISSGDDAYVPSIIVSAKSKIDWSKLLSFDIAAWGGKDTKKNLKKIYISRSLFDKVTRMAAGNKISHFSSVMLAPGATTELLIEQFLNGQFDEITNFGLDLNPKVILGEEFTPPTTPGRATGSPRNQLYRKVLPRDVAIPPTFQEASQDGPISDGPKEGEFADGDQKTDDDAYSFGSEDDYGDSIREFVGKYAKPKAPIEEVASSSVTTALSTPIAQQYIPEPPVDQSEIRANSTSSDSDGESDVDYAPYIGMPDMDIPKPPAADTPKPRISSTSSDSGSEHGVNNAEDHKRTTGTGMPKPVASAYAVKSFGPVFSKPGSGQEHQKPAAGDLVAQDGHPARSATPGESESRFQVMY